jgi:hypothetical protein
MGQEFGLFWSADFAPLLGGGLEPGFRVPFSTIFHGIALEKRKSDRKHWKAVEAKLLQTAASLRTFSLLVISARALKSLVPFLGFSGMTFTKQLMQALEILGADF